jgi:mono/diheme cytochrome c family protein
MLYLPAMMHQRFLLRLPRRLALAAVALATLTAPRALGGHEIPARVAITAYVKPEGGTLRVVARVPLEAMRDLDFPLHDDGTLDIARATSLLPNAAVLWVADYLALYENGRPLEGARVTLVRIALPSDRSFESYDAAVANLRGAPLGEGTGLHWQQAMFDLAIDYPITSADSRFAIEPRLAHLGIRTTTVLRLVLPSDDGAARETARERVLIYAGDPGLIELDPSWSHAALRFVAEGFRHILGGIDHLLFVFCLVLPFASLRRWRTLVAIVTSFTVAHSLTLGAAALGMVPSALWFPPLVEALIALSIVVLAVENVLLPEERLANRWRMAFAFGLIHGFGFSFALGEQLQFAGSHLLASLAAFNIGVEAGQLLVLALALPALMFVRRHVGSGAGAIGEDKRARIVTIVGSVLVAHTAWHWMTERFTTLGEFRDSFRWPALDATFALGALRVALLGAVALALALGIRQVLRLLAARQAGHATRATVVVALIAATAALGASQEPGPRSSADGVYTLEQANKGKDIFAGACQSCHTPTVHSGPPFRAKWFGHSLGELFGYLRREMPKTDPGTMSDEEYSLVIAYLLRINGMKPGTAPLAADSVSLHRIRLDSVPSGPSSGTTKLAPENTPTAGPRRSPQGSRR